MEGPDGVVLRSRKSEPLDKPQRIVKLAAKRAG
jgi:hypothetical protein